MWSRVVLSSYPLAKAEGRQNTTAMLATSRPSRGLRKGRWCSEICHKGRLSYVEIVEVEPGRAAATGRYGRGKAGRGGICGGEGGSGV